MTPIKHRRFVLGKVLSGRIYIEGGVEIEPNNGYEGIIQMGADKVAVHFSTKGKGITKEDRQQALLQLSQENTPETTNNE